MCFPFQDNYNRIVQEQRPKKNARNKSKPCEVVQEPKRNKKKKKHFDYIETPLNPKQQIKSVDIAPIVKATVAPTKIENIWKKEILKKGDNTHVVTAKTQTIVPAMNKSILTGVTGVTMYQLSSSIPNSKIKLQNILSVSESDSTYEHPNETGVPVLSESELINAPDGIGNSNEIHINEDKIKINK